MNNKEIYHTIIFICDVIFLPNQFTKVLLPSKNQMKNVEKNMHELKYFDGT